MYPFFERKKKKHDCGGVKERCRFIVHFYRCTASSTASPAASRDCLHSFQTEKMNMVQYLKRHFLNRSPPCVVICRVLSINVPSGGILFIPQAALCQNSSCFHFIWSYLRSLSCTMTFPPFFVCVFLFFKHWKVAYH